jgi:methanogenic corrinoid protein MtbC1
MKTTLIQLDFLCVLCVSAVYLHEEEIMGNSNMDALVEALLDGDQAGSLAVVKTLRDEGVERVQIVTEGVEKAMAQLDAKCTVEQFNLLEIMLSGRAVMGVIKELFPPMSPPPQTKGTVVVGTLEGDIHDLGKNVLKGVLTASSYRVVDCGKDCPVAKMIDAAEQEGALAVSVSGLITTVIPQVRILRSKMAERGLGHIKVMAGGAALKQSSPENLNVDFVGDTAFDGLHYLDEIAGGEKRTASNGSKPPSAFRSRTVYRL